MLPRTENSQATLAHGFETDDPGLRPIHDKLMERRELDPEDLNAICRTKDILALGWLANLVSERSAGNVVRISCHELTVSPEANAACCAFCDSLPAGRDLAGQLSSATQTPDRVSIVSARGVPFENFLNVIRGCKDRFPDAPIAALTIPEIQLFTQREGAHPDGLFSALRGSGVVSLLGEGIELLLPSVRHLVTKHGLEPQQEVTLRRAALKAGIRVPLWVSPQFGQAEGNFAALLQLRSAIGESLNHEALPVFSLCSDPPTVVPDTTGMQEMRWVALSRLSLPASTRIRVFWESLGSKLVQIALRFGGSELDSSFFTASGTAAGARQREAERLARAAGREPAMDRAQRVLVIAG